MIFSGHHGLLLGRIAKVGRKVEVKAATFLTGLPHSNLDLLILLSL